MKFGVSDFGMVKRLIFKDWQIFQKQLAAYVLGLIVGLSLIGVAKPIPFFIGALLLLILLICVGGFAIGSSLLNERKEQTIPFIMSLPITPMDFFWSKLLANALIYLVPFALVFGGILFLVFLTPLPNGLLPWFLLILFFLAVIFVLSLCAAIAIESEGWNIFTQIALSCLISPFIVGLGMFKEIGMYTKTEHIFWSTPTLVIFAAEFSVIAIALILTAWVHSRKTAFL